MNNTSSGHYSSSLGIYNTASGQGSNAFGMDNTASGIFSTTIGQNNYANSYGEVAIGTFNTYLSPSSATTNVSSDRAFSIGVGTSSSQRVDGFEVFKNGKVYADELDISEITDAKQLVTKVDNVTSSSGGI